MSYQNPLTLVTPINPDKLDKLYACLKEMKYELEKGEHEDFEDLKTVHYLRWLIIDDRKSIFFKGTTKNPKLIFSSNFDGSQDDHLNDLCGDKVIKSIDAIYNCCIDYPVSGKRTLESRKNFLKKCSVKASAFYKGSPKRSLQQIKDENKLRLKLRTLLDEGKWDGLSSIKIHKKLKDQVANIQEFSWTKETFKMPKRNYFKLALLILTIIILLPLIIVWVLIVQFGHEKKDKYFTGYRSDIDREKTKVLEEYEDLTDGEESESDNEDLTDGKDTELEKVINYQNQFSQLVEMKSGKVRLLTFKGMMLFARVLIPSMFVDGELMNIPTIHFARWVLFDDNKRVLFFSNFDGSWQQYLGDFIDQSGWGLSAIFSNTTNFPKTNWLGYTGLFAPNLYPKSGKFFPGGAYDEERFLAWSRSTELSTQVWYTAYPKLSIKNVNNNSKIRVMFAKNLSEKKAKEFFKLI